MLSSNLKILAIDDDPVFLEALKANLEYLGFKNATLVQSGAHALEVMDDAIDAFDCFLVDIEMPGMDGIELVGHIRARGPYLNTPILMITAMAEHRYVEGAFLAGATDYVNKPLEKMELFARLRSVATIHSERQKYTQLASTIGGQTNTRGQFTRGQFKFADAISLPNQKGFMDFMALRNYLLTLGNRRLNGQQIIAFHISGAGYFMSSTSHNDYFDMLEDVASVLFDTLKLTKFILSHAGSGNFVALVTDAAPLNAEELELNANALLEPFNDFYRRTTGRGVHIFAGEPQSNGLMSFKRADLPIDMAITSTNLRARNAAAGLIEVLE